MTTAYWAQWSYAELMNMQGVELHEYQHSDDIDIIEELFEEQDFSECIE